MKALLFNIHDVILLLTIAVYLLLIRFILRSTPASNNSKYALAFFLGLNALASAYTLVFWSEVIRYRVFDFFPAVFLALSVSSYLLGPALLIVLQSSKNTSFRMDGYHTVHLLPAVVACGYLYTVCFRFDLETQKALFLELQLYQQTGIYYFQFVSLTKLLPVGYGLYCMALLLNEAGNTQPEPSSPKQGIELKTLTAAYLLLWVWATITHVFGRQFPGATSDYMGIAGNYLQFAITLRLLYEQTRSPKPLPPNPSATITLDESLVTAISNAMAEQQPYLNPQLTLERFAELVGITPREVSTVINRKFGQNFHEYINRYRVEAAKQKLGDENNNNVSINDIAQASGFNSKATFNRFFKKFVQCTPSEYRKQQQQSHSE